MSTHAGDGPSGLPEARAALAFWGFLALAAACGRLGLAVSTCMVVTVLALVVVSSSLPRRLGLLVAVAAWASLTGFAVNAGAQLTLSTPDLVRLLLCLGTAAAVTGVRATHAEVATTLTQPLVATSGGRL